MTVSIVVVDNATDVSKVEAPHTSSAADLQHLHAQPESASRPESHSTSGPESVVDQEPLSPSGQSTSASCSDVCSVVSKAKRAASSLWLLLHAQNCRLGGERCPHKGCNDAKLILLHLKTCPAGTGLDCPQHFNGCNQSRKLLAHYRKCRETRAKHTGIHSSRRAPRAQQHVCLVCSLVARQARNVLDSSRATAPLSARKVSGSNRKVSPHSGAVVVPILQTDTFKEDMPPPPPRRSAPVKIPGATRRPSTEATVCESPPSTSDLMRSELSAVAIMAAPRSLDSATTSDSMLLGKSFESRKTSYAAQSCIRATEGSPQTHRRPRSESLDTTTSRAAAHRNFDPTLEAELLETVAASPQSPLAKRGRSASMGVLVSSRSCDTIVEESPSCLEDQQFLMEEDTDT